MLNAFYIIYLCFPFSTLHLLFVIAFSDTDLSVEWRQQNVSLRRAIPKIYCLSFHLLFAVTISSTEV